MNVSIIITTYNRAKYLEEAIRSVLSQTFTDFELLVLDDASTDDTSEIVQSINDQRIKYIKHDKNIGITKNRNYGLSIAQGEYIAILDSDDVWLSNEKLEKQVEFLDSHSEYGFVGTYSKPINYGRNTNKLITSFSMIFFGADDFFMRQLFMIKNQIFHSSVMIRKKAIVELGGYDDSLPIWEDYEFWLRLGTKYKMANISEYLTGYKLHTSNTSIVDKNKGIEASLFILNKYKDQYHNYSLGYLKVWLKKNLKFL